MNIKGDFQICISVPLKKEILKAKLSLLLNYTSMLQPIDSRTVTLFEKFLAKIPRRKFFEIVERTILQNPCRKTFVVE